jgi:hypothetical protein
MTAWQSRTSHATTTFTLYSRRSDRGRSWTAAPAGSRASSIVQRRSRPTSACVRPVEGSTRGRSAERACARRASSIDRPGSSVRS